VIFVTTGTHHQPFDRLVRAAGALAAAGRTVRIQAGPSALRPSGCEVVAWMSPSEWVEAVSEAQIVVAHTGPATIEGVVAAGTIPIVVPRRRLWKEHVDDHQVAWAHRIRDRVHVLEDPAGLVAAVAAHDRVVAGLSRPWVSGRHAAFADAFARLADGLV